MQEKKGSLGKHFGVFSSRYSWNYILSWKCNAKMDTNRAFFPKHFFWFSKKGRGGLPFTPSCAPVGVAEYALITLSITKYPLKMLEKTVLIMPGLWIYLIILRVPQAFEDAWGSKCARVLNMMRLYMQGLHRILNITEYASMYQHLNLPRYALKTLNVAEYFWKSLKMPGNVWINCSEYAREMSE